MSRRMSGLQLGVLNVCASFARFGMDSLAMAGAARMWLARKRSYSMEIA